MNYLLIGVSHHTAEVARREGYALAPEQIPAALAQLLAWPGVNDALILSTCNRVELVFATESLDWNPWPALAAIYGRDLTANAGDFYCHRGDAAVRHLFRVAASLDSQVIGEPQILGQIKAAYADSRAAGGMRGGLHPLLARAFSTAKRVRRETGLGRHAVSISRTAAGLAQQIFGDLQGRCVLLIGAGETGALAASHFLRQGASRLLVASRTPEHAAALAAQHHGAVIPFGAWTEAAAADIIISCTGATRPILDRAAVGAILARRRARPLLLLDIAVPRDIAPDAGQLDNAFLYNIDDLRAAVDLNLAQRQQEAVRAEALIEQETTKFQRAARGVQAAPVISALRAQCEQIRRQEMERLSPKLARLPEDQRAFVEAWVDTFSHGLMQKWLHRPLTAIKAAARAGDDTQLVAALDQLFAPPAGPVPLPLPAEAAEAAATAPSAEPNAAAPAADDDARTDPSPARSARHGAG